MSPPRTLLWINRFKVLYAKKQLKSSEDMLYLNINESTTNGCGFGKERWADWKLTLWAQPVKNKDHVWSLLKTARHHQVQLSSDFISSIQTAGFLSTQTSAPCSLMVLVSEGFHVKKTTTKRLQTICYHFQREQKLFPQNPERPTCKKWP